jgi:hypothetical protein
LSVYILQDQESNAVGLLEAVDRGDVRVIKRSEHFSLALEASHALRVACKRFRQHLDRHVAIEARVGGEVNLPHPPAA